MLERHVGDYHPPPRQTSADGGYANGQSRQAKALGVHDVAFHKKAGLRIEDMVKSRWVYRKLRNFRAGTRPTSHASSAPTASRVVPGGARALQRLRLVSVVAYNLALLVRLKPS